MRVWGNMAAFLERLDDEHFKSLQARLPTSCSVVLGFVSMAFAGRKAGACRELALSAALDWCAIGLCLYLSVSATSALTHGCRSLCAGDRPAHAPVPGPPQGRAPLPRARPEGAARIPWPWLCAGLHICPPCLVLRSPSTSPLKGSKPCVCQGEQGGQQTPLSPLIVASPTLKLTNTCDCPLQSALHTLECPRTASGLSLQLCSTCSTCAQELQ